MSSPSGGPNILTWGRRCVGLASIAGFLLSGCGRTTTATETGHPSDPDTDLLYTLPGLDHGLIQSPVNILTSEAHGAKHDVHFNGQRNRVIDVRNTGHTIQLDFEPGATTSFDGKEYDFLQCHFHTPSEHEVDGVTYPMELHCVHRMPETKGAEEAPEYLVAAFLFKMGDENPFIRDVLDLVPQEPGGVGLAGAKQIYAVDLLRQQGDDQGHFYSYKGSLTTPPYSETVSWLILRHIFEAAPEQIRRINELEGDNARHVQGLFGRVVDNN